MSDLSAVPVTDTIYVVQAGDSLSKLAQRFYGDASKYPIIADKNNLDPKSILFIGSKIVIPAAQGTVPAVETPAPYVQTDDEGVITVTSTAKRIPARSEWWTDWRIWAGVAVLVGGIWYIARKK